MAQQLRLSRVSYSYPDAANHVLEDVSLTFPQGWTGIVGTNGCGKTTLACIAAGMLEPASGSVAPHLSSAYCAQDSGVEPEGLLDFACDYAPDAVRLRRLLRIDDDMPWRFSELSCGEQKKVQVAVALWRGPELLVVDEPTNHVDAECRVQLARALRDFPGIGLLVSHDRELLDDLVSQCVSFEGGSVVLRPGSYTAGRDQAAIEARTTARLRGNARAELARLTVEQRGRREQASRADARRSAHGLDRHDSDGREKLRRAIVSGQDGKAGWLATRMDARVKRARDQLQQARVEKRYEGDLWVDSAPSRRKTLLHVPACEIPCGPDGTLRIPEVFVGNTDRIGIVGANGAGKSTLVRYIIDLLGEAQGPRMLYIGQELGPSDRARAVTLLGSLPAAERGRLLSIVAQLGSDPDRILDGHSASPGELRKVAISYGFMRNPELVVLDEPTNHLDLRSVEALESALAGYRGALVLVSHDTRFLDATTSIRLEVAGGVVTLRR